MSDFIYSSRPKPQGELTRYIQGIYHTDVPVVAEWHGEWGSLAASRNLYNGFQPLETDMHIFVVIGGPVLYFQDNTFLVGNDSVAGTRAIYERWQQNHIQWDEDLSGPFVVLVIDKQNRQVSCITDLMMFIPVYYYEKSGELTLGTHVDALASAADQVDLVDTVSLVDFVLNGAVTYPFTAYANIRQCHPAAVHEFELDDIINSKQTEVYWVPREFYPYSSINQAALALREGLQDYVERITVDMNEVAQFISAGEDSRALAGLLPQRLKRDAFIFLDKMNREGRIAKKAAEAYSANFNVETRSDTHYLDILPEAADLIGTGHQYTHAHSLGFHKICKLDKYSAVFGGYLSDSLLKSMHARKVCGFVYFPFIPEFVVSGETRSKPLNNTLFKSEVLEEINQRRYQHLQKVQTFRKQTAHEWFVLWPATMRLAMPNLYSNCRLFRSYEPFMSNQAVKISASVPTSWKLNHRLFNKAMRPFLRASRFLFHADGRLPYYPWWVNSLIQFVIWWSRYIGELIGLIKGNQGPWGDWNQVINSKAWENVINQNQAGFDALKIVFSETEIKNIFEGDQLDLIQKINLLQILYSCKRQ